MSNEDPVHNERRLSPEDSQRLCEDAQAAFLRHDLEEARTLFQQARSRDPFGWKPIQGLGVVAFKQERLEDAWALLLAAFEAAPDDEDNAENLAAVGEALDRRDQVVALLSQAARRFPTLSHLAPFRPALDAEQELALSLCSRGEELLGMELWREAMFPFMEALEHSGHCHEAWNGLGIAAWRQNYHQISLEYFRKAVETTPSDEDSVLNYAESLTRNGKGNAVLGMLLGANVPRELCAKVLDLQPEWQTGH